MKERFKITPNMNTDPWTWDITDEWESERLTEEKGTVCFVIYNDLGSVHFSSAPQLCDLLNKLNNEKESWKHSCCGYMNIYSILSMDCQIVQEAIWDLEKAINDNKSNSYNEKSRVLLCLEDLKKKFDELQKHRLY